MTFLLLWLLVVIAVVVMVVMPLSLVQVVSENINMCLIDALSFSLSLSLSLSQFQLLHLLPLHHLLNVPTMASTEYNINNWFLLVMAFHIEALVVIYKCVIMEHTTVSVLMILLLLLMISLHKLFVLTWGTEIVSVIFPLLIMLVLLFIQCTWKIGKAIVIITYVY